MRVAFAAVRSNGSVAIGVSHEERGLIGRLNPRAGGPTVGDVRACDVRVVDPASIEELANREHLEARVLAPWRLAEADLGYLGPNVGGRCLECQKDTDV